MARICLVCNGSVENLDEAIQCKGECGGWFHISCTSLLSLNHLKFLGLKFDSLRCPRCNPINQTGSQHFWSDNSSLETSHGKSDHVQLEQVVRQVPEIKSSVDASCRHVEEMRTSLIHLEEELDRLQLENSRIQSKIGHLWRSYIRLEDNISELQLLRSSNTAEEYRQQNNGLLDYMISMKKLLMYGLLHFGSVVIFAFFFTRYMKKTMKKTRSPDED